VTRAGRVAGALVALALALAGATGALHAAPPEARLAHALLALVVLPGAGLVALGADPPGGRLSALAWSFGLGVAWCSALALLGWALRVPVRAPVAALPWLGLLPWALALARGRHPRAAAPPAARAGLPVVAAVLVLLAAAVVTLHAARLGTPLGYTTDSPDHVATLRRMLDTGATFPQDAFFRAAGRNGADVRKGLWHVVVAWIAAASAVSPYETWRLLGAWLVPFFVLIVAALGFACRGPTGAALAAWAFALTYGGGLAQAPLRQAVFATRVADALALAASAALLADLARPARGRRVAAVALGFAAVSAHVFAAVHLGVVIAALGVALLLRDRGLGPAARRLAGTALALAAACTPYLVARWLATRGPVNAIHGEPQGLVRLFDGWQVVSFGQLWVWLGAAWVLVPLAWPWLVSAARPRSGRDGLAALYLLSSTLVVALTAWNPAVLALAGGTGYLLMRMVWVVPLAALLAWALPEWARAAAEQRGRSRLGAVALLALAVALLVPRARDAAQALADPGVLRAEERAQDPARWRGAFAWMEANLAPGTVVLSDPATSYLVPMTTGLPVVTVADQHGPPGDAEALARLGDARDALDPWAGWPRVREVLRSRGVGAIALDGRFAAPPRLAYGSWDAATFRAERARLDAEPAAFPRLHDEGDFVVYGVRAAALDTLSAPPPARPWLEPWPPSAVRPAEAASPALAGLDLPPGPIAPGASVVAVARWHAARPAEPGDWRVMVRCDREPPAADVPACVAKPVRKALEKLRGVRFRFRDDHVPVGGRYAVDRWGAGEVVVDTFALHVPADAAPGRWRVSVLMLRLPVYGNLRLSDWFFERDSYTGVLAGTLVVGRVTSHGPVAGRDPR
jgi:hypothetical protein